MNQFDNGHLNNVINGLEDEAFGAALVDEKPPIRYLLFYVNGKSKLEGHLIEISINHPERDGVIFLFSQYLAEQYPKLDSIDLFNTFQKHTRTMLEKIGYWTFSPTEINAKPGSSISIIAPGKLGVFEISLIDKILFLKGLMGSDKMKCEFNDEEYVYLMLNSKSNLVKIGQSRNPSFREKTLQSEEPEIEMIAFWKASKNVEKELHNIYSNKRERGEWFRLSLKDLKDIKEFMAKL